jgi:uncharacterized membrane protein
MIGLAIGAGALLGFALIRRARWRHAYGYGHGGCGHHHGWHGYQGGYGNPFAGGGGPPWGMMGRMRRRAWAAMAWLDLSPAQEKLVRTEFGTLREKAHAMKSELRDSRGDLARAIGGETFDKAALDGVFARHDRALGEMRGALAGAIERVHASLDETQREKLSQIFDKNARPAAPGAGPYRV